MIHVSSLLTIIYINFTFQHSLSADSLLVFLFRAVRLKTHRVSKRPGFELERTLMITFQAGNDPMYSEGCYKGWEWSIKHLSLGFGLKLHFWYLPSLNFRDSCVWYGQYGLFVCCKSHMLLDSCCSGVFDINTYNWGPCRVKFVIQFDSSQLTWKDWTNQT